MFPEKVTINHVTPDRVLDQKIDNSTVSIDDHHNVETHGNAGMVSLTDIASLTPQQANHKVNQHYIPSQRLSNRSVILSRHGSGASLFASSVKFYGVSKPIIRLPQDDNPLNSNPLLRQQRDFRILLTLP